MEDPIDKPKFDLRKSGLIEKKNRTTRPRLPATNFPQNVVHFFFKWAGADNDPVITDGVLPLLEDLAKMVCVGCFLVDEIELAIEIQGLGAIAV